MGRPFERFGGYDRKATIRPKRQFVPRDNSSQATIRPKFQKATIPTGYNKPQIQTRKQIVTRFTFLLVEDSEYQRLHKEMLTVFSRRILLENVPDSYSG